MANVPFPQTFPLSRNLSKVLAMAGYVLMAILAMAVSVPAAVATFGALPAAPVVVSDAR